jgi:hypothetical protein
MKKLEESAERRKKKQYQKPRIVEQAEFEARALDCNGWGKGDGGCGAGASS